MNYQNQYKSSFVIMAVSLLCSCDTEIPTQDVDNSCMDPRPEVCTKEFVPVCGLKSDKSLKSYPNKCTACADKMVIGYNKGECS